MRKFLVAAVVSMLTTCSFVGPAFADDSSTTSLNSVPRYRFVGMDLGVGVPSGISAGLVLRPIYFARFEFAGTYNLIAPGGMVGITLDPVPFAVSPVLTGECGATFSGPVPFMTNPISVEYKYCDALGGIGFGNWRVWRFELKGGMSYVDMQTHNFNNAVGSNDASTSMGDPRMRGWIPAAKINFTLMF